MMYIHCVGNDKKHTHTHTNERTIYLEPNSLCVRLCAAAAAAAVYKQISCKIIVRMAKNGIQ